MAYSQQKTVSFWQQDFDLPKMPSLQQNLETEICIVGAGIAGLLTALALLKEGHKVVILERGYLEKNETSFTTAHLCDALDDGFQHLLTLHGLAKLQLFYQSHHEAISLIEKIISEEKIECDFKRLPGYLFLSPQTNPTFLEQELEAAHLAGAHDAHIDSDIHAGFFDPGTAIQFPLQATLHPLKFVKGLINAIIKHGGLIFEQTNVNSFQEGSPTEVKIDGGLSVQCKEIILATNGPTSDNEIYFKQASYRTYVIGTLIPKQSAQPGLYWDTAESYHYLRSYTLSDPDHDLLLIGGEDHRVGEGHPENAFENLKHWAQQHLNLNNIAIVAQWSGQIMEPVDGIAFIGRSPDYDHIYFITGDSGHGFTHAAIASQILPALIRRQAHPWEKLYSPRRFAWKGLKDYLAENGNTLAQYGEWMHIVRSVDDLPFDEGRVITQGMSKVALYKDVDGKLHGFSAACPHMKGIVTWNSLEKTWDCPCHGSRFSKFGECLHAPTTTDLNPTHSLDEGGAL